MAQHRIVILPGDGIGLDVVAHGVAVLKAVAPALNAHLDLDYADIGGAALEKTGVPLPEETLKKAMAADAVLLGAVGDPKWETIEPAKRPEQGLLQIRKAMGLYANLRPVQVFSALSHASTLKQDVLNGLDMMIVRELTGGLYFGARQEGTEEAWDTMRHCRAEVERIAHTAFQLAQARRKQVCSVDKANVLASSRLWRAVVEDVTKQYPDVSVSHMYVDNAAMQLIREPGQFDVMLTENMFGDILSDEASMLVGSLGMLPSASLGEGKKGLYEPVHGSSPCDAGQDRVNPIATILSVAMTLKYSLGYPQAALWIEQAITEVLQQRLRTFDILEPGATLIGTKAMGEAILARVSAIASRTVAV